MGADKFVAIGAGAEFLADVASEGADVGSFGAAYFNFEKGIGVF